MQTMVPQVVKGLFYVVAMEDGSTEIIPVEDVKGDPCEATLQPLVWGDRPVGAKRKEGWGCRLTLPGFLDCTEWALFDTEEEAWRDLVKEHPAAFVWEISGLGHTATLNLPTIRAAEAVASVVEEVDGNNLYRHETTIFALLAHDGTDGSLLRAREQLDDLGFQVEET